MKVGFVMLAHTSLHRAADVARMLSQAGCPMVIHVDARVGDRFERFQTRVKDLPDVSLAPRVPCEWGTWSLVQASRDGAQALLEQHPDVTHICLISGSCLPIKSIAKLEDFLAAHKDTDFIESVTIGDVPWTKGGLSEERFLLTFPFAWKRQRRLFDVWVDLQRFVGRNRRLPKDLSPHMGSQWWCLTRETLETILNDTRRAEIDRYFQRVWIPDESYFQTLVRLYGRNVESRSLTLSKFDFQGKPHVFYDDHLALLRHSQLFFARKIWPGASMLYRSFLDGRPSTPSLARISPAHIDRTFIQASARRTRGRAGMVMTGRFPGKDNDSSLTAARYAVFHGFSDVFQDFAQWSHVMTGSRTHGHLFSKERVEFTGGQLGFAGAMSDSAALRDYDPVQFLRNLVWNTRGEHQSFLFSPRDTQEITEFLAADRNANIFIVTGAWSLPLLRSGRPIAEIRKKAARLQKREAEFVRTLSERRTRARARIWSLAEFLESPLDPLQEMVDSLSGAGSHLLAEMPEFKPMAGLPDFLQSLRNVGMNPHLAGEITEDVAMQVPGVARFG